MKSNYRIILLTVIGIVIICLTRQVRAQDTLIVEWRNPDGTIKINALYNAFRADTINRPPGRVYKLKKGGYYANQYTIDNTGRPLRIVGEAATANSDSFPPLLQMFRIGGASVPRMIVVQDNLTLKNLWITGADDFGMTSSYQPIQVDGSGHTIIVDNCIIDRSNFAVIAFQNGTNNRIYFTNNKFRNLFARPAIQPFTGRGISVWADQDTCVVENNTFFNIDFTSFQMESGAIKYLRFNHNTLVNIGGSPITGAWWREAYFANSLIINASWKGSGSLCEYCIPPRYPGGVAGMFAIGALPTPYGPEAVRRILLANTASWRDARFDVLYSDSVHPVPFADSITKSYFNQYPTNMRALDTSWLGVRPNISTYPDSLISCMVQNRRTCFYGTQCEVCVSWPLPENFSYTTPAHLLTAGTDHLPLGDLNWFPPQKAQFEANKAAYIDTLHRLIPGLCCAPPPHNIEAEVGTLSGTASVSSFAGFSYLLYRGSGYIRWSFPVPAAGQYDLVFLVHERGRGLNGPVIRVGSTEIHDKAHGWGQFIFDDALGPAGGLPNNTWIRVNVAQDSLLAAEAGVMTWTTGTQNLSFETGGWGELGVNGIDVIRHGTTDTLKLRAPDANFAIVEARGEGAPWLPSGLKYVALNTNGSITWDSITALRSGTYSVSVVYQNYIGPQTVEIKLDGTTVIPALSLPSRSDSLVSAVLSPLFHMPVGMHSLSLHGNSVNIDFIQLFEVSTSVSDNGGLPERFALEQNYPNPFNPTTNIKFRIPQSNHVMLKIFDVLGREVARLIDDRMDAGEHSVQFSAENLSSGVYFYRLQTAGHVQTRKLMVLR